MGPVGSDVRHCLPGVAAELPATYKGSLVVTQLVSCKAVQDPGSGGHPVQWQWKWDAVAVATHGPTESAYGLAGRLSLRRHGF
jgi:hypothetical protein